MHNHQKLEITRRPLNLGLEKHTVVRPFTGINTAVKKKNIQATTWTNLECIMPSARGQAQKVTFHMVPFIWHSGKDKLWDQGTDQWFPGLGMRKSLTTKKWEEIFLEEWWNYAVAWLWWWLNNDEFAKTHQKEWILLYVNLKNKCKNWGKKSITFGAARWQDLQKGFPASDRGPRSHHISRRPWRGRQLEAGFQPHLPPFPSLGHT